MTANSPVPALSKVWPHVLVLKGLEARGAGESGSECAP